MRTTSWVCSYVPIYGFVVVLLSMRGRPLALCGVVLLKRTLHLSPALRIARVARGAVCRLVRKIYDQTFPFQKRKTSIESGVVQRCACVWLFWVFGWMPCAALTVCAIVFVCCLYSIHSLKIVGCLPSERTTIGREMESLAGAGGWWWLACAIRNLNGPHTIWPISLLHKFARPRASAAYATTPCLQFWLRVNYYFGRSSDLL